MLPIFSNFSSENESSEIKKGLKKFGEDLAIIPFEGESDEDYQERVREIINLSNDIELFLSTKPFLKKITVLESLSLIMSDIFSDCPEDLLDIWNEKFKIQMEHIKDYVDENKKQD